MLKKWILKYGSLKLLSLLPFRLGWHVNHWRRRKIRRAEAPDIYAFSEVLIMTSVLERVGYILKGKMLVKLEPAGMAQGL